MIRPPRSSPLFPPTPLFRPLTGDEPPGPPPPPRRIRFNFRTAFAEALANAIAYGNHRDPGRFVRVRVEVARDAVRLHVTDEGNGFDPTGVPDPTLPERLEREAGRGLFVLKSLVDQVAFNEKGNSVCLTLRAGCPGSSGCFRCWSGSPECSCGCGAWARPPRHPGRRGSSRFPKPRGCGWRSGTADGNH